jgi:soluble lytic murein transglycosylase-like protein
MTQDELVKIALGAAITAELDPALVCAVCARESSWEPYSVRYEPAFYDRYISSMKNLSLTEMIMRSTSWGLMQIMGQTARELGFDGKYLSELLDPATGVLFGCKKLKRCLQNTNQNVQGALLAFNGGGEPAYPELVLANYAQFAYLNTATRQA